MEVIERRQAFKVVAGVGLAAAGIAADAQENTAIDRALKELHVRLHQLPGKRNYTSIPAILTDRSQWDSEALELLFRYRGGIKQVWDATDLASPWLPVIRNCINTHQFALKTRGYLPVCGTRGSAQLALYDEAAWAKYGLAALVHNKPAHNIFQADATGLPVPHDPNSELAQSIYGDSGASITALRERGTIFLACHNATYELARHLHATSATPSGQTVDETTADLTNHLPTWVIVTPGVAAVLPILQQVGYHLS
jgi:hypothetical protein